MGEESGGRRLRPQFRVALVGDLGREQGDVAGGLADRERRVRCTCECPAEVEVAGLGSGVDGRCPSGQHGVERLGVLARKLQRPTA